jgi:hypothetical protein
MQEVLLVCKKLERIGQMIDERHKDENYSKGKGSEYDKLKKFGDRIFEQEKETTKHYYFVDFKYKEKVYFCLWYTDEVDGFHTNNEGLEIFDSLEQAKNYCTKNAMTYNDEHTHYDIDKVEEWVNNGTGGDVDWELILDFWNIAIDLTVSLKVEFIGNIDDEYNDIYDKLFYGNNLPTINTSDKEYIPEWTEEEVLELKQVIGAGVLMFALCFGAREDN